MMERWTADEFVRNAEALVAVLESSSSSVHSFKTTLSRWKLEHYSCPGLRSESPTMCYLNHPPVVQPTTITTTSFTTADHDTSTSHSPNDFCNERLLLLEDDSVETLDPNGFIVEKEIMKNQVDDQAQQLLSPSTIVSDTNVIGEQIEWHFSIVYSDTWQVPILYFTVLRNGSPCTRRQVLNILDKVSLSNTRNDNDDDDSSWDFVSVEEHPVTGIPSCFLHPCQSWERLKRLNVSSLDNLKCDGTTMGVEINNETIHSSCSLLLSWMSMILPAVGYCIPPKLYQIWLEASHQR